MQRRRAVANALRTAGIRQLVTSGPRCLRQQRFPPPDLAPRVIRDPTEPFVDPNVWLSAQLPAESALAAFAHRSGLGDILDSSEKALQACLHPSFVPYYEHHHKPQSPLLHNGSLSPLGNTLLGLFAAERLHLTYPHLPTRVLKAAVTGFVGSTTCAAVARALGAASLVRWRRTSPTLTSPGVLLDDALASIPRALVAILYNHGSMDAARTFFDKFFMSRELDIRSLIKFRDPKLVLKDTVSYFKRERPVSRILSETGRYSNSPMFIVGIFSGTDKLGEGFGSSLKMAEYRAAEDALHRLYLTQQSLHEFRVPSSTLEGDIYDPPEEDLIYNAAPLGHSEVLVGSSGRAGDGTVTKLYDDHEGQSRTSSVDS